LAQQLIKENLAYFEGNEINETLVDPYMIVSSIYMQTNELPKALEYLAKAENVVKNLNGEMNEKFLEIYSLQIQINMMTEEY